MKSLRESFDTLPNDKSLDGIILTSERDGIFTGGLDIFELYDTNEQRFSMLSHFLSFNLSIRLSEYWTMVQNMWLSYYLCPLPGMFKRKHHYKIINKLIKQSLNN